MVQLYNSIFMREPLWDVFDFVNDFRSKTAKFRIETVFRDNVFLRVRKTRTERAQYLVANGARDTAFNRH